MRLPPAAALALAFAAALAGADELGPGLRGTTPLDQEGKAPPVARVENTDVKRGRAHTSEPPTIPHAIDKYEITRNVNFCMYCHSRVRNQEFGAPMVSATHYMNREYDFLAEISPRRYFCTQCHVTQTVVRTPVSNSFIDVYDIIAREQAQGATPAGEKHTAPRSPEPR